MPPPLAEVDPLVMVRPEKLTVPVVVTLKMRNRVEELRRTVTWSAPGPKIVTFGTLMSGRACVRLMMQPPAAQNSVIAKSISALPPFAIAASIAPRSEQPGPQWPKPPPPPESDRVLTLK